MHTTRNRLGALSAGVILAAGAVMIPASASATAVSGPSLTHNGVQHCGVDSGSLLWGVKTSFRSYITGSIANGSWTMSPGVEYVQAEFTDSGSLDPLSDLFAWSNATGEVDSTIDGGSVAFTGELFFTGHNGALQMTVADPAVEFDGEDTYLLLTIGDSDGSEPKQVRAGKIDTDGAVQLIDSELSISEAPVRLTAEGAAGLNGTKGYGSYTAGQEMDPVTLTAQVSGCDAEDTASATDAVSPGTSDSAEISESVDPSELTVPDQVPWLPVIAGGAAVVVIVGATIMLLRGKKTQKKVQPGE